MTRLSSLDHERMILKTLAHADAIDIIIAALWSYRKATGVNPNAIFISANLRAAIAVSLIKKFKVTPKQATENIPEIDGIPVLYSKVLRDEGDFLIIKGPTSMVL